MFSTEFLIEFSKFSFYVNEACVTIQLLKFYDKKSFTKQSKKFLDISIQPNLQPTEMASTFSYKYVFAK